MLVLMTGPTALKVFVRRAYPGSHMPSQQGQLRKTTYHPGASRTTQWLRSLYSFCIICAHAG